MSLQLVKNIFGAKKLLSSFKEESIFLSRQRLTRFPIESMSVTSENPREKVIIDKLTTVFRPSFLSVVNESYMHSVPKGSETHFKVVVVSDQFEGVKPIERHRRVNDVLKEELATGMHALSIHAKTPSQWQSSGRDLPKSPPCMGGMGL